MSAPVNDPVPAVKIDNVVKTYSNGTKALKGLSLEIKQGEFFALLGPNGSGKSTLINIMSGPTKKTSGTIEIAGIDIDKDREASKRMLGVVPQEIVFDSFFTVNETLRITAGYYGVKFDQAWSDSVLENLNLIDKKHDRPRALSGGMKRRLLIAKALIHKPKVLFLDEPTAGVDVELRHLLWEYMNKLNQDGLTILLTTHYLEEAENLCERIAIINKGELVALKTPKELIRSAGDHKRLLVTFKTEVASQATSKLQEQFAVEVIEESKVAINFTYNQTGDLLKQLAEYSEIEDISTDDHKLEDIFIQLTYGSETDN